jgi:hypothetical protein
MMKTSVSLLLAAALCAAGSRSHAGPFDQWLWRNPTPTEANLNSIAYGNNLFVAAGAQGTALTSADGINWAAQSVGVSNTVLSLAYGNNTFVAVGYGPNGVEDFVSPDGTNWSSSGVQADVLRFQAIAYGPDGFIVVGAAYPVGGGGLGLIANSPDGAAWSAALAAQFVYFDAAGWGAGEYVAGQGNSGGPFYYSPDGINWTAAFGNYAVAGVAYGNGEFVAVGPGGMIETTSLLDIWAAQNSGVPDGLLGVAYGGHQFVAVGVGGTIVTSPDGIHWFSRNSGTANNLAGVAYDNCEFIAVGVSGTILISSDATNWVSRTSGPTSLLPEVFFAGNQFVALSQVQSNLSILTSHYGNQWIARNSGTNLAFSAVTFGTNQFLALGQGVVSTSQNGTNWTAKKITLNNTVNAVIYAKNVYVAVGSSGSINTSPSGATWTSRASQSTAALNAIAYGNNTFVCTGNRGTALTSPDGTNWTDHSFGSGNINYDAMIYTNGQFVVAGNQFGGSQPTIATSPDGINWAIQVTGLSGNNLLRGIAYGYGTFIVAGQSGTILTSPDATNWTSALLPTQNDLYGVAAGWGGFVVVGNNGTILQTAGSIVPPLLGPVVLSPGGGVGVTLLGAPGQSYSLQASADLATWTTLTNLVLGGSSILIVDPSSAQLPRRFYRASTP